MAAQLEQRNEHGFPTGSEPVRYAWEDSREANLYRPLRDLPITMEEPQLAWIDYVFAGIAVGFLAVLARFVYVNWPVIGALLHLS